MIEIHQQIPGLLANPRAGAMSGHPGHVHLSSAELDEEQDVDPFHHTVSTVKKSHARMPRA
jgi:hypothetical protein